MDAQQRLLLERSMEALQASAPDQATPPARTSVIVGIGTVDYTSMSAHLGVGIYVATGMQTPLLAAACSLVILHPSVHSSGHCQAVPDLSTQGK